MTITNIDNIAVKGGVVRVIDSATGDIARTTSGWIEDEKYGVFLLSAVGTTSGEFDSSVTMTGRLTVKISTDATGRGRFSFGVDPGSTPDYLVSAITKYGIPIKPLTAYKIVCNVKTANVALNSVYLLAQQATSNGVKTGANKSSNKVSGDNALSTLTITFTSESNASYLVLGGAVNVAGNISDAWFDLNSMTLEEVSTITNSGSAPALLYPKVTAVTSNDNIDQSQILADNTLGLGQSSSKYRTQQFLPTKANETGFIFQRGLNGGTYVGDVTISIQKDNGSNKPNGIDLITPQVISNAVWSAYPIDTDWIITYPKINLTIDGSTKYHIIFISSTADNTNFARLKVSSSDNPYSSGALYRSADFSTFTAETKDLYFKTLYSKNTTNFTVSTDTETLSVTAPTTDGWADGTVVEFTEPLTLAPGVNNIYYSSNGPATADGEVDPSLQATVGGVSVINENKGFFLLI